MRVSAVIACAIAIAAFFTGTQAAEIPLDQRRSTYEIMNPENRAMQDDDTANPATLWVLDGEALWKRRVGEARRACEDCHGDAAQTMKGVAARYPAFEIRRGKAITLENRVNLCRTEQQRASPLAPESRDLLALTAFLARQSRDAAITPAANLASTIEQGRALFNARQGQLNLSCAQCHDDNWGQKLAGVTLPQGHATAYPIYRLEWQTLGSLRRRLRNCLVGMRAEPYAADAREYVALEAYLMWRARGMPFEGPGVRP